MRSLRRRPMAALLASWAISAGTCHAAAARGVPAVVGDTCGICHDIDGISRNDRIPSLAAQPRDYLVAQLRSFRSGRRRNDGDMMRPTAESLSDAEVVSAASYFSALPAPPPSPGRVDAASARLYLKGDPQAGVPACAACHGATGRGEGLVPRLTGQRPAYLEKQLADFASGRRSDMMAAPMREIARHLRPAQQHAISAFAAALGA